MKKAVDAMYKGERANEILTILESTGYATVEYLAQQIHISPSSIRRDLTDLEARGLAKRSYGGAQPVRQAGRNIPFQMRSHAHAAEKKAIAKKAVSLLQGGEVIFLDGSSTCFFLAEQLTALKGILVITNSIDTTAYLSRYEIKTYCTGGIISQDNRAVLVDEIAENTIRSMHADFAFFSSQSLGRDGLVSDCYASEVRLRRAMMEQSVRSVLLADSSKLDRSSTFRQCEVKDLDYVICDRNLTGYFSSETGNAAFLCP
ncbi:MAG: DeoR/GlpR transcriptional regulator [Clostridia bacterium]|nr:DeoR/GlpR transcriptional regulator [Clostridia bacterium]